MQGRGYTPVLDRSTAPGAEAAAAVRSSARGTGIALLLTGGNQAIADRVGISDVRVTMVGDGAGHEGSAVIVGLNGLRLLRRAAWQRAGRAIGS